GRADAVRARDQAGAPLRRQPFGQREVPLTRNDGKTVRHLGSVIPDDPVAPAVDDVVTGGEQTERLRSRAGSPGVAGSYASGSRLRLRHSVAIACCHGER
ncbi:hypothetical protein ACSNOB_30240, partial [Micromonospora sp. URMC 106]